MEFKKSRLQSYIFVSFFACLLVYSSLIFNVKGQTNSDINILYFNQVENRDPLLISLDLDPRFNISLDLEGISSEINGINLHLKYDIIYLVDPSLSSDEITKIKEFMSDGGSIIYICGPNSANNGDQLVDLDFITINDVKNNSERAIPGVNNTKTNIFTSIDWNSAPEVANYTIIPNINQLNENFIIDIFKKPSDDSLTQSTFPLIMHGKIKNGFTIFTTSWFADDRLESQQLWPYFNYLIYSFTVLANSEEKKSYADWQYSPVPHLKERILWSVFVFILLFLTIYIFLRQKKKSKKAIESEIIEKIAEEKSEKDKEEIDKNLAEDIVVEVKDNSETTRLMKEEEIDEWEEIGYHRQLSGFLFALFMAFILIGPQLVLTLYVYPNFILPYPQAGGYYSFVLRFFEAFWLFLDFGTSTAAAKFFAQYRVKNPEKAVKYVQIYIWWQFLSGIGQFFVVSMIGLYVFPYTNYAHMSWFFILHSMIQFPGFLAVFMYFFQGVQRLDIAQLLELLKTVLLGLAFQYAMVLLCRYIFGQFPQFGEVFGAVVGMALGSWFAEIAFFLISFKIFKNVGYEGNILFRIDFGKDEIRETFKYGISLVVGNVWVPLVWFLQVILISLYVLDYSSEMAYFDLAMTLTQVMSLVGLYLGGMIPPISEALGNDKKKLLDLGIVEMLRIMNWIAYSVGAILLVCGNRIIIGLSGPTWERATIYFLGLLLHAIMGPYSWSADKVFQGTGRTDLNLYTWILEQGIRAILLLILIPSLGMPGVIIAYNIALFTKGVVTWILIRKIIWHGKVYPWKTFVAPIISAICLWVVLESMARLIWTGDIVTSIIITVISIFGGIYLSAFLNGFFGLWDDNNLKEFKKAANMVKSVGFLSNSLYKMAEFGAIKLKSPFHKINPIDIYEEAMVEAVELTHEKRVLDV